MYPAVPAAVPVRVSAFVRLSVEEVLGTVLLAASAFSRPTSPPAHFPNPKSSIFTAPHSHTKKFAPLISPGMMSFSWGAPPPRGASVPRAHRHSQHRASL